MPNQPAYWSTIIQLLTLKIMSDLHEMIDREFKQAGIEIAFPQQDLHIRSMPDHLEQLEPYRDDGGDRIS